MLQKKTNCFQFRKHSILLAFFAIVLSSQVFAQQASAIVSRPPLSTIANVQVSLRKSVPGFPPPFFNAQFPTSSSGVATFTQTFAQLGGNGNYEVYARAVNNTRFGYLNGVSSLDLVFTSRHILGTQILSPFHQMCADINGSETISTADVVISRQLILGITDNFGVDPIGVVLRPSWLFWSENATNLADLNSLKTNEINAAGGTGFFLKQNVTSISNLSNIPIIAGKLGDVNSSSTPVALIENTSPFKNAVATSRTSKAFDNDLNLKNGEEVKINVSLLDNQKTIAWQWGAKFDANNLEVVKIEGVESENFYHNKEANTVTALNFVPQGHFSDSKCLTITLKAKKDISSLSNLIQFDNELIETVAYDVDQNADNDAFSYEVVKNTSNSISISPNPFKENLNLSLPNFEGEAKMSMFDATGRAVLSKTITSSQSTIDTDLGNLSSGVYFISIMLPNGDRVQQKLVKQ